MPYELGVTEVGPAEYPLLDVLRDSIFAEVGHRSLANFAELLDGRKDVLTLIAHLEGNPVGFKVGCADRPGVYHSRSGGVLKDYRRLGLGRRMQDWQHQFAVARGYRQIFFNTFNHFPGMIRFGLASGFHPVAAEWRGVDGMSFKFVKDLSGEMSLMPFSSESDDLSGDARVQIDHRDASGLVRLMNRGFQWTGISHDLPTSRISIILEQAGLER